MNDIVSTEGNVVTTVTAFPGEVIALPAGKALRVRAVSGTAYITHTGRDLFLWCGDVERLGAVNVKTWGAPIFSAMGKRPATVVIESEGTNVTWESWIKERQEQASDAMKDFWMRLRVKFDNRHTRRADPVHRAGAETVAVVSSTNRASFSGAIPDIPFTLLSGLSARPSVRAAV